VNAQFFKMKSDIFSALIEINGKKSLLKKHMTCASSKNFRRKKAET